MEFEAGQAVSDTEFGFQVEGFKGCRVIRTIFPSRVNVQTVSVAVSKYLALFDTDEPIVALNDVTSISILPADGAEIVLALLKRNSSEPRFYGSAWFTGANDAIAEQLRELCGRAGRDPASIVTTEAEAYAYLRTVIHARESARDASDDRDA